MATIIRYRQFDSIAREVGRQAAIRSVSNMTRFTKLDAQRTVPIDKGELRGSAVSNVERGALRATGTVRYRADHAMAVHEGARPHIIRARAGGKLIFTVRGRRIVTDSVNHPGNRANPWLYEALRRQGALRDYRVRRRPASIL